MGLPPKERTIASYNVVVDFGKLPNGKDYKESVGGFKKRKEATSRKKEVTAALLNGTYTQKYPQKNNRRTEAIKAWHQAYIDTDNTRFNSLAELLKPPQKPTKNEYSTLADCLDSWIESPESDEHIEPSTMADYKSIISQHLKPDLGGIALADFKPQDFKNYIRYKENPIQFVFGKDWSGRIDKQIDRAKRQNLDKRDYRKRLDRIRRATSKLLKNEPISKTAAQFFERFDIPPNSIFGEKSKGRRIPILQYGYLEAPFYSKRMCKGFKVVLNIVFDWAIQNEDFPLPKNPLSRSRRKGGKTKKGRKGRKDIKFWEPHQVQLFFKELEAIQWQGGYHWDNKHWLEEVFYLAAKTGIRRSELAGLRWECVDLDKKTLEVREAATFGSNYKELDLTMPKSEESERTIKLDSATVNRLRQWRIRQDGELAKAGMAPSIFVFTKLDSGWMIHPQTIGQSFITTLSRIRARLKERGQDLPEITLHGLRHSHASLLINRGQPPMKIQRRLGHSSIQITYDTYGHLFEDSDDESADVTFEVLGF